MTNAALSDRTPVPASRVIAAMAHNPNVRKGRSEGDRDRVRLYLSNNGLGSTELKHLRSLGYEVTAVSPRFNTITCVPVDSPSVTPDHDSQAIEYHRGRLLADGGRVIDDAEPAGPEDLAAVDQGDEIVLQFSTVDGHGIESIRGPACHVHESDTAVTVTVRDLSRGIFDLILPETDDGHVLDAGIEGQTHAAGYLVKDIDEIETLEIHEPAADGGEDIEHHADGFVSQEHLLDEHSPEPVPEREPRCTERNCSERGLDYCDCCGRHLCGRHNETQGGFCSDFTQIHTTEFGEIPCCPRVLPDGEPLVDANPQLIYPAETDTQERAQQAAHSDLQAAVRQEMPAWQVQRARELLQEVREAVEPQRALAVHCETAETELRAWLRAHADRRADVQLARAVCRLDASEDCLGEDDLGHAWEVQEARGLLEDAVAITGGETDD